MSRVPSSLAKSGPNCLLASLIVAVTQSRVPGPVPELWEERLRSSKR
jgi:hypothetical protein